MLRTLCVSVTGDFQGLRELSKGLARLSNDGQGLTLAAMRGARLLSDYFSEQQRDPLGRPWAPLALSTLRHRRRGPILLRIHKSRRWRVRSPGRFIVENLRKPHDGFHTSGTRKMPARPDLPVMPGGERPYLQVMSEAIGERIAGVLRVS